MLVIGILIIFSQVGGNIVVLPDSGKRAVSPYVFGSGDEMNANFSPLSATLPLIDETAPRLLRYGGIGADYLDWEGDSLAGIWYIDFVDTLIIPVPVNFGVDSLLRVAEYVGALPILTVNMQIVDTLMAKRMVEYVNGDTTTTMGRLRAQRGHPEPYNVTIWSLGNEPDIAGMVLSMPYGDMTLYWTFLRHFGIPFSDWSWQDSSFWTPQDFANLIPMYAQAMQSASPIPLSFIFSIAGDPSWLRPVIEPNVNLIDYLDVHYYPSNFPYDMVPDTMDYVEWLSKPDTITPAEDYIQMFRDSLDNIGAESIKIIVMEYGPGLILAPDTFWWNYLCGLFIADVIGHFIHKGVEMACIYSIHEGSPGDSSFPYFGIIRGDTTSRRMASYVLELYSSYFGDTLIYSHSDHKNNGYGIECWASKRSYDGNYVLVVINKTLDTTYTMNIKIRDSIETLHIRSITNNAPLAAPYNGTTGIEEQGYFTPDSTMGGWSYFTYTFTPASVYLIEAKSATNVFERRMKSVSSLYIPTILKTGQIIKFHYKNTYFLYTCEGRRIKAWNGIKSIQIPSIPSGLYILTDKDHTFIEKLIIVPNTK
jgi:hypothetical protein